MKEIYNDISKKLKAMADPKRLKIIDMLSCGELCACVILESFNITQPTLSHHMKILIECGLVIDRRDGKNIYYSLNLDSLNKVADNMVYIYSHKDNFICNLNNK